MKKFSKILSVALLVALVLSLGVANAFADPQVVHGTDVTTNPGSITIKNATVEKNYSLYKLFDATLAVNDNGTAKTDTDGNPIISYTLPTGKTLGENAWFTADANGTVSAKAGADITTEAFRTWAKEFGTLVKTAKATDASLTFDQLEYGYYFVESEVGAVLTVDSTTPSAVVIDKNQETTYDKQEQIANGTWVYQGVNKVENPVPSANVGDTVNYKVVGTLAQFIKGEKVVSMKFTDTMSDGLTANQDVKIFVGDSEHETEITSTASITYSVNDTTGVTTTLITFPTVDNSGEFLYANNIPYRIAYSAVVNEKAIVDTDPEDNTVDIKFNENNNIGTDTTKVTDYQIILNKEDGQTHEKLAGAQFKLYDAATNGNEIPVVLVPQVVADGQQADPKYGTAESAVNNVYRHAKTGETGVEMVVGKTGIIEVKGLANGSYYFEETVAPAGYNKLTARSEAVIISNANATVTVNNNKGAQLPSTGGIGTTIFYVVGGVLVLAAIILLVTKKRMSD